MRIEWYNLCKEVSDHKFSDNDSHFTSVTIIQHKLCNRLFVHVTVFLVSFVFLVTPPYCIHFLELP